MGVLNAVVVVAISAEPHTVGLVSRGRRSRGVRVAALPDGLAGLSSAVPRAGLVASNNVASRAGLEGSRGVASLAEDQDSVVIPGLDGKPGAVAAGVGRRG